MVKVQATLCGLACLCVMDILMASVVYMILIKSNLCCGGVLNVSLVCCTMKFGLDPVSHGTTWRYCKCSSGWLLIRIVLCLIASTQYVQRVYFTAPM